MKTYEDLVNMGAPILPSGYYYSISTRRPLSGIAGLAYWLDVSIYRKKSFLGIRFDKLISKETEGIYYPGTLSIIKADEPDYQIVKACKAAYEVLKDKIEPVKADTPETEFLGKFHAP